MAKLTMAERRALPKSDFAVPSKAPGPGSYPMPDKQHAAVAKGLAAMHHAGSAVEHTVDRKANAKLGHHRDVGAGHAAHTQRHLDHPATHHPDPMKPAAHTDGFAGHGKGARLGGGAHGFVHHSKTMC